MTIKGPSTFKSEGYVLRDGDQVQHARVVVLTDPTAEKAMLELQEVPDPDRPLRRITGKQPLEPGVPQIPPPRILDDQLPLGLQALHWDSTLGGESTMRIVQPTTQSGLGGSPYS